MEAESTSETSASFYRTIQRNNPQESHLYSPPCEHQVSMVKLRRCSGFWSRADLWAPNTDHRHSHRCGNLQSHISKNNNLLFHHILKFVTAGPSYTLSRSCAYSRCIGDLKCGQDLPSLRSFQSPFISDFWLTLSEI